MRVAKQYLSYFQGAVERLGMRRSAPAARDHPGESPAHLRRPRGDRDARRYRLGARTAPPLRPRDGHRADPHRGPSGRRDREQSDPSGGRDRQRRRRQGRALHATVRRVRHPAAVPVRHARHHGRARRSRRPRWCATPRGCSSIGANITVPFFTIVLRKGYGLGAQAMAGGSFKTPTVHRRMADRRVRRHGTRGRGEARLSQRAGGGRGSARSARSCSTRWSRGCTSTARRSTSRRTSRSTT